MCEGEVRRGRRWTGTDHFEDSRMEWAQNCRVGNGCVVYFVQGSISWRSDTARWAFVACRNWGCQSGYGVTALGPQKRTIRERHIHRLSIPSSVERTYDRYLVRCHDKLSLARVRSASPQIATDHSQLVEPKEGHILSP